MKAISTLGDLRTSEYGWPDPRHGLELLHWFSRKYISIDVNGRMKPNLDHPQTGAFGFCLFYNHEQILPKQNLPYYEVGNLHGHKSDQLPQYVRQKYTHRFDGSNKDRIIISLNTSSIVKVYVTEHMDGRNFNPDKTYEVSQSVIEQIREMEWEQFLQNMQHWFNYHNQSYTTTQNHTKESFKHEDNKSWSWCTII